MQADRQPITTKKIGDWSTRQSTVSQTATVTNTTPSGLPKHTRVV